MNVKRHQLLSYVLDNNIISSEVESSSKSKYVCICLLRAALLMSGGEYDKTYALAKDMQNEIEHIIGLSLRSWMRSIIGNPTDVEIYEYRILWVTAMRDACLKADV